MYKEFTKRGEELALQHWNYIEELLVKHDESERIIELIRFHYISAFIHGYKHAMEDCASERYVLTGKDEDDCEWVRILEELLEQAESAEKPDNEDKLYERWHKVDDIPFRRWYNGVFVDGTVERINLNDSDM